MLGIRHAYSCAVVVTGAAELPEHAVIVADGRVQAVLPAAELPSDIPHTRLKGAYLAPGLVDIHVHGAGGRGYNEASSEGNRTIGATLLRAGITTALPTLASDTIDALKCGISAALELSGVDRPRLPGVQLEGPYLALEQAGAQDRRALRQPSDGSASDLIELADRIAIVALAPELEGAPELIELLTDHGIIVAAGHSNGTARDLREAQRRGLSHVTHLFSGQSTIRRVNARRVPGILEGTLTSVGLTVEMIADGHHLPDELMQLAYRCLGGNLCLVSDASPGAGLPEGSPYRMAQGSYVVDGGVGMTLDRQSFGGSTTLLSDMLPIAARALGCPVFEVLAMATSIPARAAGLADVGVIAPGAHADFVLLNDHLTVLSVALGGQWLAPGKETP